MVESWIGIFFFCSLFLLFGFFWILWHYNNGHICLHVSDTFVNQFLILCLFSYNALEQREFCKGGKEVNKKAAPVNPSSKGNALGSKTSIVASSRWNDPPVPVVNVAAKHSRTGSNARYGSVPFQTASTEPPFYGSAMPNTVCNAKHCICKRSPDSGSQWAGKKDYSI